jgi:alpha-aminoadipate/glutamate carrier protein LysW
MDLEIVSIDPLEVAAVDVSGYDDEDSIATQDEEDE